MPVHFVVGPAGSGKTHLLRDKLAAFVTSDPLSAVVLYVVPKQTTFTVQRAVALDPRLGGFTGVRVISPDDLAELALVETGRPAGARLDATGRSIILGHLLRQEGDALEHFRRSANRPGLAAELDKTFQEFERAGQALGELQPADAEDGDFAGLALGRKVRDLAKLYRSYQQFLTEHGFDPHARQTAAPEAIASWSDARDALVLVDDFYDFTVYERQILVALAGVAKETYVALPMDPQSPLLADPNLLPNELGLFRRTETAYRSLHFALKTAQVPAAPPTVLTASRRWKSAALVAVSHALDAQPPRPAKAGDDVRFCLARDAHDELEVAAREVKRLLAQNYRLRDICVLARSIEGYAAHVEVAFTEHDLPYFLDRRRPGVHHPLVRTLQAIGQVVTTGWANDGVFDLLKAGLTDVPAASIDLLADYVRQHRVTPTAWASDRPWRFKRVGEDDGERRPLFDDDEVAEVNRVAALLRDAIGPLVRGEWSDRPQPISRRVEDLYHASERLRLREAMAARVTRADEANDIEVREEEEQVWSRFGELMDRLHELLGVVELTGGEFFRLLETALDGLELAVVPPTLDEVLVGSIDRTRVGEPKAVILVGLNECDFPLCQSERPVLNDADRHRLLEAGVEIEPPTRTALLMERFLGYVALSRASEKLVLIRTACDKAGGDCQASPFWDAAWNAAGRPEVQPIRTGIERIVTPKQAVSHLLLWARRQHATVTPGPDAALYQWMTTEADVRTAAVRNAAWPSLRYRNAAKLSPAIAAQLYASPLEASVSRFESFASCPFQHFAKYGLRLQRPPEPEFTAMDLGNLYHAVLDELVGDTIRRELDFVNTLHLTPDQVRDVARRLAEVVADQLFLSDARSRYTLEHLERTVHKLIRGQQVTAGIGEMRPAFTELTFGDKAALPAVELPTPAGHVVKLRGKIDRVDLDANGSAYTVVDYKLAGEELKYDYVAHGLMLQLLTYLLVLEQHGEQLAGKPLTPAAALYVRVLRRLESVKHPRDAAEPDSDAFHLKEKPRGVVSRSTVGRIDPDAVNGNSRVLAYKLKKDGGFYASGNDGVDAQTFGDLMRFVRRQIVELADEIIAGDVGVSPYLIGKVTPCQRCDLLSVCRLDRTINRYRILEPLDRTAALDRIRERAGENR